MSDLWPIRSDRFQGRCVAGRRRGLVRVAVGGLVVAVLGLGLGVTTSSLDTTPAGAAAAPADLVVLVTPVGSGVRAGSTASFKVSTRNVGGVGSSGQVSLSFSRYGRGSGPYSFSGSGWSCPTGGVTCVTSTAVAVGGSLPDLTVSSGTYGDFPTSPGFVELSVAVANASDGVTGNNSASAQLPVVAPSGVDLVATLAPVGSGVRAGSSGSFKASVRNLGQASSSGQVEVSFFRYGPGSGSWSFSGSGWSCPTGGVTCVTSESVPAGGSLPELTVSSGTNPSFPASQGPLQVAMSVTNASDGIGANNSVTAQLPVVAASDVDLVASLSPVGSGVRAGSAGSFEATVRNVGQAASSGQVEVTFFRYGAASGSWSFSGSGWSCPAGGSVCVSSDPVPAGGSLPGLTVSSGTNPSFPGNQGPLQVAMSIANGSDAVGADNSATAQLPVTAPTGSELAGDLGVRVVPGSTVGPGGSASTQVGVTNSGSASMTGRTTVQLSGSSGTTASGSGWTCTAALACTHEGALAAGASLPTLTTSTPVATANPERSIAISATADHASDQNPANNGGYASVQVGGVPVDITLVVTTGAPVAPGATASNVLTVANAGTTSATGRTTVQLSGPSGTTASGSGWTCTAALACTHEGAIAAGASLPALTAPTLIGAVNPDRSVAFSASVGHAQDSNTTNNDGYGSVQVGGLPVDLALQVAPGAPVAPGAAAVGSVAIVNGGAATATGRTTVQLSGPTGTTASGSGWRCTAALACTHDGTIAAGASLPVLTTSSPTSVTDPERSIGISASSSHPQDTNTYNNDGYGNVQVGGLPTDLTVQLAPGGPLTAGTTTTVIATVTSTGLAAAGKTTVQLSSPFASATATGDGWDCTAALACVRDTAIPANATLPPLTLLIRPPAATVAQVPWVSATWSTAPMATAATTRWPPRCRWRPPRLGRASG